MREKFTIWVTLLMSLIIHGYLDNTTTGAPGHGHACMYVWFYFSIWQWNRQRWDNDAHVNFSIIVDPNYFLDDGLLTKTIVIPVDMRYHMEDKTNPGTFTELYTTFTQLTFDIEIPGR